MLLMMPTPAHNSSESRRFLPASSAHSLAAQRKFNTPKPGQSVNRFANPTLVGSSTPFAKTPSVRRPQDEIETGCEEQGSSSPVLPTRSRFVSSLCRQQDAIDDASDEDEVAAASRPDKIADDDEDELSDLLYSEKLRGANFPPHSKHEEDVLHRFEPMPRKRQKISDTDTAMDDVIAMSSSPSPEPAYFAHVSDDEDFHIKFSHTDHSEANVAHADEDFPSSPTGPASALASSKFRIPLSSVFPTPTSSTRPSFKTPQVQNASTSGQSALSSLPDAFSPSRRRGRRDYIPGGAADTVRSWILALAADASKADQTYIETFTVVETTDDYREGRCTLVKGENGRRWLLINEGAKAGGRGSGSSERKITAGCSVGIRAGNTALNLQLDSRKQLDEDGRNEIDKAAEEWSVGTLWDIRE